MAHVYDEWTHARQRGLQPPSGFCRSAQVSLAARVRDVIWRWPDGLLWRVTEPLTLRSRGAKFDLFLKLIGTDPRWRVLDVGGGGRAARGGNYFEHHYPHPARMVTCVYGVDQELAGFRQQHPQIRVVAGDGRALPFADNAFDVVVSNAVIEHVGTRAQQQAFVAELARVARRVFLATPNRWFPVDTHTLIPLAHYLPPAAQFRIYRLLGREYWASIDRLNLLGARTLRALVPAGVQARLVRLRLCGLTHSLVLVLERP
jgi:2-polyprenyl-3-methyl-5-hydroxy-6-metoxy-1,4-benzoquinol methylase